MTCFPCFSSHKAHRLCPQRPILQPLSLPRPLLQPQQLPASHLLLPLRMCLRRCLCRLSSLRSQVRSILLLCHSCRSAQPSLWVMDLWPCLHGFTLSESIRITLIQPRIDPLRLLACLLVTLALRQQRLYSWVLIQRRILPRRPCRIFSIIIRRRTCHRVSLHFLLPYRACPWDLIQRLSTPLRLRSLLLLL